MLNGDKYLLVARLASRERLDTKPLARLQRRDDPLSACHRFADAPIPAESWYAWERTWYTYDGYQYLAAVSPLFIHQFSHAWVDFRGRREERDPHVDYYQNSIDATHAQREFFINVLSKEFPKYSAKSGA